MNKSIIKQWLSVVSVVMCTTLFQGCSSGTSWSESQQYSFMQPVQIVDVDTNTKSFRIVVKVIDYNAYNSAPVYLDTINTTARHNKHFVNYVGQFDRIGDFTSMGSDMFYRDVELLPDGITNEVSIFYYMHANIDVIDRLEVILRPKRE